MDKMIFEPHAMHGETVDGEGFPLGYISIAGPIPTPVFALEPVGLVLPGVDMGSLALIMAEAPAMVEALRDNLNQFEQMESMFRDDVEFIAALKATRAILSRIDGAGDTLPDAPVPGLWRIVQYDPAGDVTLYWSNANGWGGLARSDGYSQAERETLNLPMGGQWWFDRDDDSDLPVPAPTGELVTVRADHLAALVGAAGKYADDLETGLEDGTYEDRADLDAVRAALAVVRGEN